MAGNGARRDRRHRRRWIIAASFAGQAAIIAVVAAGSARGTSAAVSEASATPAPAAVAGPPPPAPVPPSAAASSTLPAVPLPPGEIGVTVSAAGPGGTSQSGASQSGASQSGAVQRGDIGFPAPEDPPLLVLRPGADTAITVTLAIPPGARVRGLWLGVAADQGAGPSQVRRLLVASLDASPGPGRFTRVLHWALPAGTPAGAGSQLVLNVRHAGGADDQAPIAELVAG